MSHAPVRAICALRTGRALSGDNDGDRHATPRADLVALDGFPSARGIGTRRIKGIVRTPAAPRCGGFGFAFDGGDLAMIGSMQKIAAALASAAGKIRLTSRFAVSDTISRIAGSPDRRIAGSPDRRIAGSPDRRIAGSPDRRIAGSPDRRIAGSPDRRIAGSPDRRIAGSPDRRVAGSPGRRVAGSPGRRVAGSPGRRVAGSPGRRVAGSPGRPTCVRGLGDESVRRMAALAPVSSIPV